jgi:hypothetical protein
MGPPSVEAANSSATEGKAMRRLLTAGLILSLMGSLGKGYAGDFNAAWRPAVNDPIVTLGRPQPLNDQVLPVSFQQAAMPTPVTLARGQSPDLPGPALAVPGPVNPGVPASPAEQYNCGVAVQAAPANHPILDSGRRLLDWIPGFGHESFDGGSGRGLFQSDHCFDGFISPVSNPFFFEDPRALTELRPIFIFQGAPTKNPVFRGGDVEFFGVQARLAVTERLSFVLNKLGGVWIEPHNPDADFQSHSGFAEIDLGPKFTFLRCESTGTLGAVGLTFQIPAGDRQVLQDTGNLGLVPYLSMGQNFFRTSYGSFNALGTIGYDFSIDKKRSENLFASLHLDYDIANLHRFYPLVEVNWFDYTRNGTSENLSFEGRDLFNFGSQHVSGHSEVSIALGGRVKLNECIQFGTAVEFPVTSQHDLMSYRVTADIIFRY